jgi:hypothetical protein
LAVSDVTAPDELFAPLGEDENTGLLTDELLDSLL